MKNKVLNMFFNKRDTLSYKDSRRGRSIGMTDIWDSQISLLNKESRISQHN
jgi:hypothetical protein